MKTLALTNKRIVITRAREQAETLAEKIEGRGGMPVFFPTIAFAPVEDCRELDRVLQSWGTFEWVIFTSANGVRFAHARWVALGLDVGVLRGARVGAIGSGTAAAAREAGLCVDFVPGEFLSEQVARELPLRADEPVLLLRADIAPAELATALTARGAKVTNVQVYRTVPASPPPINWRGVDAITFTSGSTVENFVRRRRQRGDLKGADIFCIGPVTARKARELGMSVTATAKEHTIDGLVAVMCEYYGEGQDDAEGIMFDGTGEHRHAG